MFYQLKKTNYNFISSASVFWLRGNRLCLRRPAGSDGSSVTCVLPTALITIPNKSPICRDIIYGSHAPVHLRPRSAVPASARVQQRPLPGERRGRVRAAPGSSGGRGTQYAHIRSLAICLSIRSPPPLGSGDFTNERHATRPSVDGQVCVPLQRFLSEL